MTKGILFDLDGTLWDSTRQILPAWNAVLRRRNTGRQLTHAEIRGYMGKTVEEIAALMLPEKTPQEAVDIAKECCREELGWLLNSGGTLYADLVPVLEQLRDQYALCIVSNCQNGYIETFLHVHRLKPYFCDFECSGNTGRCKGENIAAVMKRRQIRSAFYLGDTEGDQQAAGLAKIPFVHAAYGFGKAIGKVPRITALKELPALAEKLL